MICCVSLVGQWIDEASSKLAGTTRGRICQYHGPKRVRDVQSMAANYDVVVGSATSACIQRACLPAGIPAACACEHSSAQSDCLTVAGCRQAAAPGSHHAVKAWLPAVTTALEQQPVVL